MNKNTIKNKLSKFFYKFSRFIPRTLLTILGLVAGFAILGWFAAIIGAVIGYLVGFLLEKALLKNPA